MVKWNTASKQNHHQNENQRHVVAIVPEAAEDIGWADSDIDIGLLESSDPLERIALTPMCRIVIIISYDPRQNHGDVERKKVFALKNPIHLLVMYVCRFLSTQKI